LGLREAAGGFKPASITRDEADCSHRRIEELRCQTRDAVERNIGRRIENAAAVEGGKALVFG
jgi:hypothetical protein